MKRVNPIRSDAPIFVEALEPRIAPAGLLNESKFTSVTLGTPQLLDASGGPNDVQGISTGSGAAGSYLLYITAGKALVYTSDLNGNGRFDPGEITGIAASVDSQGRPLDLLLFTDLSGDIVTNLLPGHGVSQLTDSDNNPANGRDGRVLLPIGIHSVTLRTVTDADLNANQPGDTVPNRIALTSFSIYGNIYTGGDFGAPGAGLAIDTSGAGALSAQFDGRTNFDQFLGVTAQVGGIFTGSAAGNQHFHFTQTAGNTVVNGIAQPGNNAFQGTLLPFTPAAGVHGGDITGVTSKSATTGLTNPFNVGSLETGHGGFNARGGNITNAAMDGNQNGYSLVAGDGGQGPIGAAGGSIINFTDVNSSTSEVDLHTGHGGVGLLGAGGAGGTASFGNVNIAANVNVILGGGGDGFTAGGAGSGLTNGAFTAPEGTPAIGSKLVGTYHQIGDIGNTHPLADGTYSPEAIDFNGDGFGDTVYTTTKPDQIVVLFGDGGFGLQDSHGNPNSTQPSLTIRLHAAGLSNPVFTVADFNGDGRPDIVAASANDNNLGGVYVFLNQIGDAVRNPLGTANFSKNPLGAHPFSPALQSALPTLADEGFYVGPGAISALTAGDFNADGIMDVGYVQFATQLFLTGSSTSSVVGVLFGSANRDANTGAPVTDPTTGHPEGSGYFFANPAAPTGAANLQNLVFTGTDAPFLKSTSLASSNVALDSTTGIPTVPEVLLYAKQDGDKINVLGTSFDFGFSGVGLIVRGAATLGKVDTNRATGPTSIALTDASLQDFVVQDINGDGNADLAAVSSSPKTFVVTFQGSGFGDFAVASGGGDNAGLFLGSATVPFTTIATIDGDSDGHFNEVAILALETGGGVVEQYTLATGGNFANHATLGIGNLADLITTDVDTTVRALDAFYEHTATVANPHPVPGFAVLTPDTRVAGLTYLQIASDASFGVSDFIYETDNGFHIFSGAGGNSLIGSGGAGGALGNSSLNAAGTTPLGSISFVFPIYLAYEGHSFLDAGRGGSGFVSGGAGGDIQGISSRLVQEDTGLNADIQLVAGDGGNGVSGDGGRGGVLSAVSLNGGTFFTGGNGGTGLHGGAGGSVLGNKEGTYDTSTGLATVITGAGGFGALGGGNGGSITGFDPQFIAFGGGTSLTYVTGGGGGSPGGTGGSGGNITDSSPDTSVNSLGGDITLDTGAGGDGLIGGIGGAVTNFVNQSTSDAVPMRLNVITGHGGIGIAGAGGAGGTITNFQSNATGLESFAGGSLSGIVRLIAGNGGASYATSGGVGGSVINTTATATSTPLAVVAGAGGNSLVTGGAGGSIINSVISSAAQQFGKVLAIAGAGGDATAVTRGSVVIAGDPNTGDLAHALFAQGGANGFGGQGGSINGFTQPTGAATAVDLIAGNGGSTINVGSPLDPTTGVGPGGSVLNVNLIGTVGSITRDLVNISYPPIRAYNDVNGDGVDDETINAFVQASFGGTVSLEHTSDFNHSFIPNDPFFQLSDQVGNVGIVAGRPGQVKGGQGASDGVSGSVMNVTAGSIMSIVAGSVNSVSPVQVLSGIRVTNPDGVLGADKSPAGDPVYMGRPNSMLDYYNPNLPAPQNPVQNLESGYRLIDGALFAIEVDQPASAPFIAGPRVFFTKQVG